MLTERDSFMNLPYVFITGTSTGIGFACAVMLDKQGFNVFAGVRKEEDAERLRAAASNHLIPLLVDVTNQVSIVNAFEIVKNEVKDSGLAGLVNNAGIGIASPIEYFPPDDLRYLFEVNVFGQIFVTQTFLPLLRKAKGRIINIGSVGDRFSIPFGGGLCASKSAFASVNDALRLELSSWGIKVCLIEPASIFTPAVDKVKIDSEKRIKALSEEAAYLYASKFRQFTLRAIEREEHGSSADVVAKVILNALISKHPKTRYPVGKDSTIITTLAKWMPDKVLDMLRLRIFGLA
jgi:NAD(P)-dependent dehydrogenase (short-subunit alcohol dehydrogenase family)